MVSLNDMKEIGLQNAFLNAKDGINIAKTIPAVTKIELKYEPLKREKRYTTSCNILIVDDEIFNL